MNVVEAFGSGTLTKGQNPSGERRYVVTGVDMTSGFTEQAVIDAVAAAAPTSFAGLLRDTLRVEQVANDVWTATVNYSQAELGNLTPVENQPFSWSFSTGGQSERVELAITQTGTTLISGATIPDNIGNQIAVDQDGVPQGVDIVVPRLEWSETHTIPAATVEANNGAWIKTVSALTGKVNSGTFRSFAAGEVLFTGASGSKSTEDSYSVTFNFVCSPNVDLSFPTYDSSGQIQTGSGSGATVAKKGHDYVWFLYRKAQDDTTKRVTPITAAVFVSQVYPAADFDAVLP